jgi:hypothetical protein
VSSKKKSPKRMKLLRIVLKTPVCNKSINIIVLDTNVNKKRCGEQPEFVLHYRSGTTITRKIRRLN